MLPRWSAALALVIALAVGLGFAACEAMSGSTSTSPGVDLPAAASTAPASAPTVAVTPLGIPAGAQRVVIRWISDGDTVGVRATAPGVIPQDGDTVVRLLEIDTPESKDPDLPVQCFALKATRVTTRLLPRGSVGWLEYDRELHDRYGRTLAYVWNARGVFVNERLVGRGLARAVYFRPNDRHLDRIRAAEQRAKAAGRGLWSHC